MKPSERFCLLAGLLGCLAFPAVLAAAGRPTTGPQMNNHVARPMVGPIQVQEANLTQILQCLLGPGVQVENAVLTTAPGAAGLFTGGAGIVGIGQGLILSSGNITTIVGPNMADDTSYNNGLPGDADLDGLIPGYTTFDATILEFDFSCDNPAVMSFQYVFASEEYNEWVASPFNDVFGFFLNGVNIATVPTICSSGGIPVAINNVDCQNPYAPPNGPNCDCFRNNDLDDGGGLINTEMDGLTQVFYATGMIQPGTNHMKIAIADAGDPVLDSSVLLDCQSFVCQAVPDIGGCCEPGDDDCFLKSRQDCEEDGGTYLGDGVTCFPDPCNVVPIETSTWGKIKARVN
jgi:hypothetical protein